ncbi:MAG: type II toxin-antitoxin system VapC family toxin [Clostridium sp.]|nr:type II toxin-antitoxin system VapC family toxin [Clostridium sp.]
MNSNNVSVIYWDSSAVLSTLLLDSHSEQALRYAGTNAIHLLSSLALAEAHAVLNRIKREHEMAEILVEASLEALSSGPWRKLRIDPETAEIKRLASKWPLRGADLWHLATAKTLQRELPELLVLTFDKLLYQASVGESIACQ